MAKITVKQLAGYAADQLESGVDMSQVASQLAGFLLQARRSKDVSALIRAIDKELTSRGNPQMTITSAHEVTDSVKKQLSEMLQVKNPTFTEVIDQDVIGGVKAKAGELEVDLTVRGRLNRFKNQVNRSSK